MKDEEHNMSECECKDKWMKPLVDEFLSFSCTKCGRIWVNTLCGFMRPTERFNPIPKPLGGVWIGHTFIKDPVAKAINSRARVIS